MPSFRWTAQKQKAAIALADGQTQRAVSEEVGINGKTLWRWMQDPEFSAEVDRLTLMMGIANRAERLRIAQRVVRQRIAEDGAVMSDRDVLDWLKFAQSETDGIRLDMASIEAAFRGES